MNNLSPQVSRQETVLELHRLDQLDVALRQSENPGSEDYIFHISREPDSTAHCFVHYGSTGGPIGAATRFVDPNSGSLCIGDPTPNESTHHPLNQQYSDTNTIAYSTGNWTEWVWKITGNHVHFLVGDRTYKWQKSWITRRSGLFKSTTYRFIVWNLTDVTDGESTSERRNSIDPSLSMAELSCEGMNQDLAKLAAKKGGSHGELANLSWHTSLDEQTRVAAIAVLLTVWHRDRCMIERKDLGPYIEVATAKRPLTMGGWGSMPSGAVGAIGMGAGSIG